MSTWTTLYDSDTIPFMLDIGEIDAASGSHVFTTGTGGNYTIRTGTVRSRITVTSAANEWESGDAHAELFSGTRIAVLYPQFLENVWATSYSNDPVTAENQARAELIAKLQASGINPDPSLIKTEALYTGDIPNALPVRLDLWKN